MSRPATTIENKEIEKAKAILLAVGLKMTGLTDHSGGAVIPAKGF